MSSSESSFDFSADFLLSAKKHTPALETRSAEESVPWEEGKYCCGSPCHGTRKPRISPALFLEGGSPLLKGLANQVS